MGLGKLRARIKRLGQGQWVRLPTIPTECEQSYHMFHLILLRFPFFNGMRMAQTLATHFDGPVHVSNYPVHRALHKLGLRSSGARHCFHKWL
jgi:hypothetical protein